MKHPRTQCPYKDLGRYIGGQDLWYSPSQTCSDCEPHIHDEKCEWVCSQSKIV